MQPLEPYNLGDLRRIVRLHAAMILLRLAAIALAPFSSDIEVKA
jgi:hypothetical protein